MNRLDRFLIGLLIGVLLMLGVVFVSHAHPQTIVTGGNRKVFPAYVNSCTLTFYDPFTGTGALSSCWTAYSSNVATRAGGVAAPAARSFAVEFFTPTGAMPANQTAYVSISFTAHPGISGVMVRGNASTGAGYLWKAATGALVIATSPSSNIGTLGTCPIASPGDVLQLSIDSAFTLTCTDLATFASDSYSDTGSHYSTGSPGFVVDTRSETGVTAGPFTATAP
jgi:hypothetical protein